MQPEFLDKIVKTQHEIIRNYSKIVKPGGKMVYATCSILPQENREQIQRFLADNEDAILSPIVKTETPEKPGRQILPGEQQMDGFYYARLVKSTSK